MSHLPAPMRVIPHPGAKLLARARHLHVEASAPIRLIIEPGDDLFARVHAKLDDVGASGGSFTIVEGRVDRLDIMTGGPGSDGLPMGFHGPHLLQGPFSVVAGAAGSGLDETGKRFTHCHAAFLTPEGKLVGGHLTLGGTIAGEGGIAIDLFILRRGVFARQFDPETHFTIFHPEPA